MTQAFEGEAASETSTSDYTSPFPLARRMKREREPSGDATVRLLPPAACYEGPARAYAAPVHVEGDQLAMITVPATSAKGGSTPVTFGHHVLVARTNRASTPLAAPCLAVFCHRHQII